MDELLKQRKLLEDKLEECKLHTGMLIPLLFKSKYQKEYDEIASKIAKIKNNV